MIQLLSQYPLTDEWKRLIEKSNFLNDEKYIVVYKKNENGDWQFYDLYNENDSYDDKYVMVPLGSTYQKLRFVRRGTPFVNVLGSTGDSRPEGASWIKLMQEIYEKNDIKEVLLTHCCTDGKFYRPFCSERKAIDKGCFGRIVGGHVLLNRKCNVESGEGSRVYMLPICSRHNTSRVGYNKSTGEGFYMVTRYNIWALVLDNFLEKEQVEYYLNNLDTTN